MLREARAELVSPSTRRRGLREHDEVLWSKRLGYPEGFTREAFEAVAIDRTFRSAPRDREPEACMGFVVRAR
jgi:hypothetical protein